VKNSEAGVAPKTENLRPATHPDAFKKELGLLQLSSRTVAPRFIVGFWHPVKVDMCHLPMLLEPATRDGEGQKQDAIESETVEFIGEVHEGVQ
jgi:hypothetical protein